jgi:Transcriptional regulator
MSQATKRALAASLKNLLLQKPLTKITINDIAEDCGISRMTFYYHFKDIYDLVEWACVEDAARALKGKKTYDTWQEGFLNIFHAVQENKPFIMNVYRCVSRERIEQYLNPLIHSLILGVVEEKSKEMAVSEPDKRFIASFYEYAFVGVVLEWIGGSMKEDPADIVERTSAVVHGNIPRALEAFGAGAGASRPGS